MDSNEQKDREMSNSYKGLLDLPPGLLRQILDKILDCDGIFESIDKRDNPENEGLLARRTLKSLRLTNRSLCKVASQALLPRLRIRLNESSLASAVELSNSPHIASGVGTVELVLEYCPENLANDLKTFVAFKDAELYQLQGEYSWFLEALELGEDPEIQAEIAEMALQQSSDSSGDEDSSGYEPPAPPETSPEQDAAELALYRKSRDRCNELSHLWTQQLHPREADDPCDELESPFGQLLLRGFAQFQRKHEEQASLIRTGRFATTVAAILSKLPAVKMLNITDVVDDVVFDGDEKPQIVAAKKTLDDNAILDLLSAPLSWNSTVPSFDHTIERLEIIYPSVGATSLFCDIPVALARANVRLRGLSINCFPMPQNADLLLPVNGALCGTEDELAQGLSSLETLQFVMNNDNDQVHYLRILAASYSFTFDYLKRCLASKFLEKLSLCLRQFEPSLSSTDEAGSELDAMFNSVSTESLEGLSLNELTLSYSSLSQLLLRIGHQTEFCHLNKVHLIDGSWADVLDTLRATIGPHIINKYHLSLSELDSTEIRPYYHKLNTMSEEGAFILSQSKIEFVHLANEYVRGKQNINPFNYYKQMYKQTYLNEL